jgi:hypothetical protein
MSRQYASGEDVAAADWRELPPIAGLGALPPAPTDPLLLLQQQQQHPHPYVTLRPYTFQQPPPSQQQRYVRQSVQARTVAAAAADRDDCGLATDQIRPALQPPFVACRWLELLEGVAILALSAAVLWTEHDWSTLVPLALLFALHLASIHSTYVYWCPHSAFVLVADLCVLAFQIYRWAASQESSSADRPFVKTLAVSVLIVCTLTRAILAADSGGPTICCCACRRWCYHPGSSSSSGGRRKRLPSD